MKRRIFNIVLLLAILVLPVKAEPIKWVDFSVPYESLKYAMDMDIRTSEQEQHVSWIDVLAIAGCRTGGKCTLESVKKACKDLQKGEEPRRILGELYKYYDYYHEAYAAVLGGLLGNYSVEVNGKKRGEYGLKAYCPIAAGYSYSHCSDFGNSRSFGFSRKHLGNDLMGGLGTPVVAVEGGVVEAMGWNRYGGWRIGVRSFDSKRYYYYAHLQKDKPFVDNLKVGDMVQAGDLLGFMGRTGYSDKENVNNIETVHLHFGMQLVFDESQKECNSEIWVDVYPIARLLNTHRSTIVRTQSGWERPYKFEDLDVQNFVEKIEGK
mgnify:CR=1 FL=1